MENANQTQSKQIIWYTSWYFSRGGGVKKFWIQKFYTHPPPLQNPYLRPCSCIPLFRPYPSYTPVFHLFNPILHILLYSSYSTLSFKYSCISLIQPYPSFTPVFLLFKPPNLHILLYSSYSTLSFIFSCIISLSTLSFIYSYSIIHPYPLYTPVFLLFNPILHYSCIVYWPH